MSEFPNHAQLANMALIEELYSRYSADPGSVDSSWRHFFEGIDFGAFLYKKGDEPAPDQSNLRIRDLIHAYRQYGHLQARFNPLETGEKIVPELKLEALGFFESELGQPFPTLGFCGKKEAPLSEIISALKEIYCSRIGFEYIDLGRPELEKWIQERLEPQLFVQPEIEEKHLLLEYLNKSEIFETFLHTKYVGQTRFSLEGAETMIPLMAEMIDLGGDLGVEEVVIGMAHRGRLNVLTNILNKPLSAILEEFEDDTTLSFAGSDDVRYHLGYTGEWKTRSGKKVVVDLAANPSHLESVDPVVLGQTYAKQILRNDTDKGRTFALMIHGDASIAGQGVVYESLQLMNLPSYSVGGSIHLVVNNQIGYTTLPEEGRSTRYCTDIAKAFSCPVFHVNAEDPESCLFAAKLALEIRQKFHCDVFIDLLCYRKHGHNEGDEPSFTQPLQYKMIRAKKTIRQLYYDQLIAAGQLEQKLAETLELQFQETMKTALAKAQGKAASKVTENQRVKVDLFESFESGVDAKTLQSVMETFCHVPADFHPHPKLQNWMKARLASVEKNIDWSTAEMLALGSLLRQGTPIRLQGEDTQRGTFSQRHLIWIDTETNKPYCSLCQGKARFDVVNSPLSEYGDMGFAYGYSLSAKGTYVIWEAQYGDFYNGAQIIVDQYIVSGEQKWNTPTSFTLLLPHAYEGSGPEHASARMERFLQLAANGNIQVVNASTPAQYFHLLRRQALRSVKKPLFVFTPKSMLRSPAVVSPFADLTKGSFQEILDDPTPPSTCKRLIFCSGKISFELLAARKRSDIAILRIEQLYPLHEKLLQKFLAKYKGFTECFWVQEEPENMGAWSFMRNFLPKGVYVGRPQSPTTATGSARRHKQEQQAVIEKALT
ncbi:MAG TPA: 2-oxoglutarate dehydrogenase E1 component [Chlamydiales bacterium]|nr:2-oxoglutarate dehydrogenase E1 component [Chlamydiales bacterium]